MKTKKKKWVVCFGCLMEPVTWGKLRYRDKSLTTVAYGEEAPWWPSEHWQTEHTKLVSTEKDARKMVEDHEATIVYDPR